MNIKVQPSGRLTNSCAVTGLAHTKTGVTIDMLEKSVKINMQFYIFVIIICGDVRA